MKIGVFLPNISPHTGGAHTFQSEIFRSLIQFASQSEHKFVFLSWESHKPNVNFSENMSFQMLPGGRIGKLASKTAEFFGNNKLIESFLKKQKIDLMFYPVPSILTYELPFAVIHWDLQHRNNPFFPEVSQRGEWWRREKLFTEMLQRAAFIFTGTQVGKAEIENYYSVSPNRIHVAPMPTPRLDQPTSESYKNLSTKYKIPEKFLFYPAQFWPHKNHANLLYALAKLKAEKKLIAPVVLVGTDKGNLKFIKKLTKELGLEKQVYFVGFVTNSEMATLYTNADALVFLTYCGPDNLPPLEAFSFGCPVIASNVPGAEEQLGEAAILVNPNSEEEIASAIELITNNQDIRKKLQELGNVRAEQFGGEYFVKSLLVAFNDFAKTRRAWSSENN